MSEDMMSNGKADNEERSAVTGKLDSMSKDDLVKLVKNQILFRKKLENKLVELTTASASFNRTEEQLRNQIDCEQVKYSKLTDDLEQSKLQQVKLQEELDNLRNELSVVRSSLSDESQKSSSHLELLTNLISVTTDLFQLPISLPELIDSEFLRIYKTELEQKQESYRRTCELIEQDKLRLQERLEDLEFFSEEIKLENDDLRSKKAKYQQEKQLQEQEIDNYRRQIEDFEEQFLELQRESQYDQSQQACENTDEIILQCMNYILHQIDDEHNHPKICKSSSTSSLLLSSDIPALLHSVGITNSTDDEFSTPLTFESVLRLCTLLIERCRVLQYILLKKDDTPEVEQVYHNQCITFLQNNQIDQCRICLRKQDHLILDTLFEQIYSGMNQTIQSNDWQIIIEKSHDQGTSPYLRLEFDHFKFVSTEIEQDLREQRHQIEQLIKQNEEQRRELSDLKKRLFSNDIIKQLKEQQGQLEQQLLQQCEKTLQLENFFKEENLDKYRLEYLKQIEVSYHELQTKFHVAEKLEEQLKELNEKFHEKELQFKRQHELFDKLKRDYERQHACLLERDEKIRYLELEINEHEQFKENLIEKFQKDIEQQKQILLSVTQNHDQCSLSVSRQQREEFEQLIGTKANENQLLTERICQLETDRKTFLLDKDKLMNEIQILNDQIKIERKKLNNEMQFLMEKITNLEKEKLECIQNNNELKQQLQSSTHRFENTMEKANATMEQGTIQLRQNEEFDKIREENIKLQQTINELKQGADQDLKEKYQKMKVLLTRLKKELQDKTHHTKQNLIDLELADYEKTIETLKNELISKEKDIQDLRDELLTSTEKYACLKLEIENLEQQKNQTDHRANKFKALLDTAKKELQQAKINELKWHQSEDYARESTTKYQQEFDQQKILIHQLINEKQQLNDKLTNQNEVHQRTMHGLEQDLRIVKHDLDVTKKHYDTLQDDFNNYKIRAQSVLKQQQANQQERTPPLVDKQAELESTIEKLRDNLQQANEKIESLISENAALEKERTRLIEIQAKLITDSKKREQELRKQCQIEIEKNASGLTKQINNQEDTIKTLTLQTETMSIAYKEQIATIEIDHKHLISTLQNQIEASELEIQQFKLHISSLQQIIDENQYQTKHIGINDSTLAWSDPIDQPAEKVELLNNAHESQEISLKPNEQNDWHQLQEECNQMKIRFTETNELLTESEVTNSHLTEQITFLKDEIRRIERNMERNESISNLEYLKNIIMKFFVLKSIPERLQLIPVLVTMLKLSPDEQNQLVRVANLSLTIMNENLPTNESSSQQMTNSANSSSWSSYLNIW
ncbi:unnamed protein product [Adineta ricciae]|uniref:GRIP domain-containing protein n=1 Tax=Adineta ricciae TaxID=249248 RepID=A0A814BNM3_ADIRI|nr:unnamed protein product [Adineta ricciae]CAF1271635.1 unnamed protein product [Adineta ricciae]